MDLHAIFPPNFLPSRKAVPNQTAFAVLSRSPLTAIRSASLGHLAKMDWQGQRLSEIMMQIMLVASAVVAFCTGYTMGSFRLMLLVYAAGVLFTTVATVPNWPWFNRHPLKWLDPSEAVRNPRPEKPAVESGSGAGKKKSVM